MLQYYSDIEGTDSCHQFSSAELHNLHDDISQDLNQFKINLGLLSANGPSNYLDLLTADAITAKYR